MLTIAAGSYSVPASHNGANVSEKACAVLPPIAGFYERLSFVGGPHIVVSHARPSNSAQGRLATGSRSAPPTIAVKTMPSKAPEVVLRTWPSTQDRNTCSKILKAPGQAAH